MEVRQLCYNGGVPMLTFSSQVSLGLASNTK